MQCEKFEHRMHQLMDHRQRPEHDPQLLAHAQVCGSCRDALDYQAVLLEGLMLFHPPETSDDVAEAIVQRASVRIPATKGNVARRRRWFWTVAVTAAAVLLLALLPQWGSSSGSTEMAIRDLPVRTHAADIVPGKVGPIGRVDQVGRVDQIGRVDQGEPGPRLRDLIKIPAMPDFGAVDDQLPRFRPITVFFGVAIDALRRSIPGGRDRRPQAIVTDWTFAAV